MFLLQNLLVTSTLTVCNEPYPSTSIQKPVESEEGNQAPQAHLNTIENGVEVMISDGDGEMVEAEADEDNKNTDIDTIEEMEDKITETSETSPKPTTIPDPSGEASPPSNEQLNPGTS